MAVGGTAEFRFYAELNDFVPEPTVLRSFTGTPSAKDLIESSGVPHTEVDLVLVNGEPVGFEHRIEDGDRVAVFPVFESFDIGTVTKVRPEPLRDTRFVLDVHLGRLARFLRLLGFDTDYVSHRDDAELVEIARRGGRILLTRDRELLKYDALTHGIFVRATDPEEQLLEVVARLHLSSSSRPFTRCMACNGELADVAKEAVLERLPEAVRREQDEFKACPDCNRVYWRGSHFRRLEQLVHRAKSG